MASHSPLKAGSVLGTASVDNGPCYGWGQAQTPNCGPLAAPSHGGVRIIEQEARNLQAHIWGLQRELKNLQDSYASLQTNFDFNVREYRTLKERHETTNSMHQAVIERMRLEIERLRREPRFDAAVYERADAWLAVCEALPERMQQPGTGRQGVLAAIRELQRKANNYDAMMAAAGMTGK